MMSMVWTGKQTTFGPIAPNPPDEGPEPPFLMPDVPYGHDPFFLQIQFKWIFDVALFGEILD